MNFNFTLYEVSDNSYGTIQENGTWNGMVNDLIQNVSGKKYAGFSTVICTVAGIGHTRLHIEIRYNEIKFRGN